MAEIRQSQEAKVPGARQIDVFFDGDCPLCAAEIEMLRRRDRGGRIGFIDIADPDFRASDHGLEGAALMASIHGRLPDGRIVEGVEVFRRLYSAVGFDRLVAVSRWPGIRSTLNVAYRVFAKNRLRVTGRCDGAGCTV